MERELLSGEENPAMDTAPANPKSRLMGLVIALGLAMALPGIYIWLCVLSQRPANDNVPQWITGAFLLLAIFNACKEKEKKEEAWLTPQPNAVGLVFIALAGLLYILGIWLSVEVVIFTGLLLIFAALCWAWMGQKFWMRVLPGFLFALFLLPQFPTDIRTAISLPLQLISTQLATGLAALFIPVQTAGNIFYVKGEAFEVTAACSGLNTWMAYLFAGMLGMLMGRFSFGRLGRLLLAAPLLALAGNAIRLWITAMVAYWFSSNTALDIHTNLDFFIFPAGLALMVLGEKWLNRRFPATKPALPITKTASSPRQAPATLRWGTMALLLLINMGAWPGTNLPQPDAPANSLADPLPPIPYQVGAWHGQDEPLLHDEEKILAPATIVSRRYLIGSPKSDGSEQPGQPLLWMNLLEARSMDALHNVVDSLIASGAKPELKGTIIIQTLKGPLKASWFHCVDPDGKTYNLLLWYEWDGGNAESRWAWYWDVLRLKLQKRQPVWRLVEIASPGSILENSPEQSRQLEQLKAFATEIYPATIP